MWYAIYDQETGRLVSTTPDPVVSLPEGLSFIEMSDPLLADGLWDENERRYLPAPAPQFHLPVTTAHLLPDPPVPPLTDHELRSRITEISDAAAFAPTHHVPDPFFTTPKPTEQADPGGGDPDAGGAGRWGGD